MCFRWLYTRLHCLMSLLLGVLIALALESLEHCVFRQPESDRRFCIFALLSLWAKQVAHVKMFEPHIIFPRTLQLFFAIRGYGLTPRLDGFSKDPKILPSFETWDEDIFGWFAWTMGGITYLAFPNQFSLNMVTWTQKNASWLRIVSQKCVKAKTTWSKKPKSVILNFDVFFVDCLRIKVGSTFHLAANGWEETSEPPGASGKFVRHPLLSLPSWAWRYRFLQLHRQEFERQVKLTRLYSQISSDIHLSWMWHRDSYTWNRLCGISESSCVRWPSYLMQ